MNGPDADELLVALAQVTNDFRDYRARVERDRDDQRRADRAALVAGALDVVDVLDAAAASGHPAPGPVVDAMHHWLASLGLERIQAGPGTAFDPTVHYAASCSGDGELVVTSELRAGWLHDGVLLRPSTVEVGPS